MDKRGQGLSVNAIVLIVLAVVVLVILIAGFTLGWSSIAPWISSNNVDEVVTACNIACSTNAQSDYCTTKRVVNYDKNAPAIQGVDRGVSYTCDGLRNANLKGVEKCPSITC